MIIEYQYVRIYSLKYKGRGISMNSNDKDELDDELIKSMKKLVEEETNVAKAFIDTQNELSDEDDELADETMGKTRVIPKVTDDMLTKVSDATINISDLNADKE